MRMIAHPSPNFGTRAGVAIDMIVIHYTAMNSAQEALVRLCDPEFEVSAHYLIAECGDVFQLVENEERAWHAGRGAWGNVTNVNSHSIGIELANNGVTPFSEPQFNALEQLLAALMATYEIPPERIIGHSDMAPDRKIDPGAKFDWHRLARQGLSIWPDKAPQPRACQTHWTNLQKAQLASCLKKIGYACEGKNAHQEGLKAFQDRFSGYTSPTDILNAAENLAQRFPVDLAIKDT